MKDTSSRPNKNMSERQERLPRTARAASGVKRGPVYPRMLPVALIATAVACGGSVEDTPRDEIPSPTQNDEPSVDGGIESGYVNEVAGSTVDSTVDPPEVEVEEPWPWELGGDPVEPYVGGAGGTGPG